MKKQHALKNIDRCSIKRLGLYPTMILALFIPSLNSELQANEGQPKLFEPYAPKPSGKAPEGWEIKILEGSQVENSTSLNGKKEIKVTVPAYELVPKSTEATTVIQDPGFDPKLATAQRETIGAVLTQYGEQSQELQIRLDKVIIELESSLGLKAESEEKPEAEQKKSGAGQQGNQTKTKNAKK